MSIQVTEYLAQDAKSSPDGEKTPNEVDATRLLRSSAIGIRYRQMKDDGRASAYMEYPSSAHGKKAPDSESDRDSSSSCNSWSPKVPNMCRHASSARILSFSGFDDGFTTTRPSAYLSRTWIEAMLLNKGPN